MKKIFLIYSLITSGLLAGLITGCKKDSKDKTDNTLKDIDGNIYHTVKIGSQVWMAENLKVTHYRNGDPIPSVSDETVWMNLTSGAYRDYSATADYMTYGKLYNWYAVGDVRNIAPKGWHVPTDTEWAELIDSCGGPDVAGSKLKEAGTSHWLSPNLNATNASGFTGLPGGICGASILQISLMGYWYSSTNAGPYASAYELDYSNSTAKVYVHSKYVGSSVRCVKD